MRGQLSVDVVLSALGVVLTLMVISSVADRIVHETKESVAHILCHLGSAEAGAVSRLLSDLPVSPEKRHISLGIFRVVEDLKAGSAEVLWDGGRVSCG